MGNVYTPALLCLYMYCCVQYVKGLMIALWVPHDLFVVKGVLLLSIVEIHEVHALYHLCTRYELL